MLIRQVYHYLGLTVRLRMMMEDKDLSKHMHLPHPGVGAMPRTSVPVDGPPPPVVEPHATSPCRNLWESVGWYEGVVKDRQMSKGTNNIALALNVDGFQPFDRGGMSLTPLLLQVLNLPENLRIRHEYIILAGVIPGKKGPKIYNTYFKLLVDELILLYIHGFVYTDPYAKGYRRAYVKLLFTACDYPAHGYVNCLHTHPATFGCQKCDINGYRAADRTVYSNFDVLHRDGAVLPDKLTHAIYLERAKRRQQLVDDRAAGRITSNEAFTLKNRLECRQVIGLSQFARLPYFDIVDHTLLDLMHTIAGILSGHIIPMLKGKRMHKYVDQKPSTKTSADKSRSAAAAPASAAAAAAVAYDPIVAVFESDAESDDGDERVIEDDGKEIPGDDTSTVLVSIPPPVLPALPVAPKSAVARKAAAAALEVKRKAAAQAAQAVEKRTLTKFQAMYHVSKAQLTKMETDGYDRIQAPGKIAPATKKPFTWSGHMTADTWLVFTRVYGKYLFKLHFTSAEQQRPLVALCNLLDLMSLCSLLSQTTESKARIAELVKVVARHFEEDFPVTEHAIVVHNLLFHIPDTINRWGPAVGFWCFPYERSVARVGRVGQIC